MIARLSICFLILFFALEITAQITPKVIPQEEADTTQSSLVIVDQADKIRRILSGEDSETMILTGNVEMHQDSLFMSCDSARKEGNNLVATGNVILQQWDSLNVFSERLSYFGNTKDAYLRDSVVLQNKSQKLFTDSLAYNTQTKIAIYEQGAILTNDTTTLYSKKGTYYVALDEIYFKDSIYIQSEEFELYADTLKFNTEEQKAYFLGPTLIHLENGSQVYCESGYYDMANSDALFTQNAQYVDSNQVAKGDSIFYDGTLQKVTLDGNATLTEPGKTANANQIIYDEVTKVLTLSGDAHFEDSTRMIDSETLVYDVNEDKVSSTSRSVMNNAPQFLEADTIDFDNEQGLGLALGNVVFRDTSSDYTVLCDEALYIDSSKYLKAYRGRPLLISQLEADSFFLSSDTLIFFELAESLDTNRQFLAFNDVRIYKSDLQALCDSLTFSSTDSLFHLYKDPIIWSDTSQFVADSIRIQLANEAIDKIYLKQNAFILNSADEILFNQMKGKEITAFFKEGEVDRMLIKGNATSIYYALDDSKAYIGVNETECSSMLLKFGNNEITDILFYDNPKSKFHPIQKVNPNALLLEGFDWRIEERPASRDEITTFAIP